MSFSATIGIPNFGFKTAYVYLPLKPPILLSDLAIGNSP